MKGFTIGIAIAAPVGPIVSCVFSAINPEHSMLDFRTWSSDSGCALRIYGSIRTHSYSNALLTYQFWFRLIGGLFLCYLESNLLATRLLRQRRRKTRTLEAYGSTLFLTITNH
jgi:hypothetical protein